MEVGSYRVVFKSYLEKIVTSGLSVQTFIKSVWKTASKVMLVPLCSEDVSVNKCKWGPRFRRVSSAYLAAIATYNNVILILINWIVEEPICEVGYQLSLIV